MKDEKKRASAKARAEKALRPKRKPGRPPKKPQTPDGPRPKSKAKAKAAPKTAALDPATKKSKALKSKKADAPPPPKKSKKAGEKEVIIKTPEKPIVSVRGWSPSPLAVQGAPSEKKRDERMVKALAALHELLAAMSSDPSPKDFHGPEAGFAKKIIIKFIINK